MTDTLCAQWPSDNVVRAHFAFDAHNRAVDCFMFELKRGIAAGCIDVDYVRSAINGAYSASVADIRREHVKLTKWIAAWRKL